MSDYSEQNQLQFRVRICPYATSPAIQKGIWDSQHFCVTDEPERYLKDVFEDEPNIADDKAGEAVIKHQLRVEHYSVLRQAFVKFRCYGFPHSTIAQITRHHETSFLVTSMRYTGEKFLKVSQGTLAVNHAFYVRPAGIYSDRSGHRIVWTNQDYQNELVHASAACDRYAQYVNRGMPFEMAREFLPYCYRQPFVIAGTVAAFFHWVDQRSKQDSEREIRILTKLCMDEFNAIAPQFYAWYTENRWGRARLAP